MNTPTSMPVDMPAEWGPDAIARRLKLVRMAMQWDQAQAGEAAGVTRNQWGNYERAESGFPYWAAQRLELRTGFPVQWIYNGAEALLPRYLSEKLSEID